MKSNVKLPDIFVFFDVESKRKFKNNKTEMLEFEFGCAYIWNRKEDITEKIVYYSIQEFWTYIDNLYSKFNQIYLIAHNTEFDFRQLSGFDQLKNLNFEIKSCILDSVFIITAERLKDRKKLNAKTKIKQKMIIFDTTNFVKKSLKELAISFNLSNKLDINLNTASLEEKIIYCFRDCEIIYVFIKFILEYLQFHNLTEFALTTSSLSFKIFRRYFLKHDIYCHNNRHLLKLEKMAYLGGMTQAFKLGKYENIDILDINSLYPFVMINNDIPTKLIHYDNYHHNPNLTIETINDTSNRYYRIINCLFNLNEKNALIISHNEDNKCIFQHGDQERVLHEKEFEYVKKYGQIKKVYSVLTYEKAKDIFKDYIEFWYNLKQMETGAIREFAKLMLNGLFGKFGQKTHIVEEFDTNFYDEITLKQINRLPAFSYVHNLLTPTYMGVIYKLDNKLVIFKDHWLPAYNSNYAIVGCCTANARMYLISLLQTINIENVLYVDTDSLFIPHKLTEKFQKSNTLGSALGQLKIEQNNVIVNIRGLKNYDILKNNNILKRKIKGVKKTAKLIQETEDTLIFEQDSWLRLKSTAKKRLPLHIQIIERITKEIKKEQPKGILDANKNVHPYSSYI